MGPAAETVGTGALIRTADRFRCLRLPPRGALLFHPISPAQTKARLVSGPSLGKSVAGSFSVVDVLPQRGTALWLIASSTPPKASGRGSLAARKPAIAGDETDLTPEAGCGQLVCSSRGNGNDKSKDGRKRGPWCSPCVASSRPIRTGISTGCSRPLWRAFWCKTASTTVASPVAIWPICSPGKGDSLRRGGLSETQRQPGTVPNKTHAVPKNARPDPTAPPQAMLPTQPTQVPTAGAESANSSKRRRAEASLTGRMERRLPLRTTARSSL